MLHGVHGLLGPTEGRAHTCSIAFWKFFCLPLPRNPLATPSANGAMSALLIHAISSVPKNMTGLSTSRLWFTLLSFFWAALPLSTCA